MSALAFVIDRVRPSIVQIAMRTSEHGFVVVGTGFIVHNGGYVLTAKHVTEGVTASLAAGADAKLVVGLAMPNIDNPTISMRANFEMVDVDVVEEDPRHDLALLRMRSNPFTSGRVPGVSATPSGMAVNAMWGLAPLNLGRPRDGDSIVVSGYPLSYPTLITTAGIIASAWDSNQMDVTPEGAPEGFVIPDLKDSYLADVAVNPGNSGGPVYGQDDGGVIGVCVAFRIAAAEAGGMPLYYNSGLSIVVPIRYGVDLLARHVDLGPPVG